MSVSTDVETGYLGKVNEILTFWFEEVTQEQKFKKSAEFDEMVSKKFGATYLEIVKGNTQSWKGTPEGRLAEIIVLDQFARNMFRDSKQSFAADALALAYAQEAYAAGDDKKVPTEQRVFFYLPYMHSESKEVHKEALNIFTEYGEANYLKYENMHKEIIDKFGRYPHRNEVLGRESTEEELEFLKTYSGF